MWGRQSRLPAFSETTVRHGSHLQLVNKEFSMKNIRHLMIVAAMGAAASAAQASDGTLTILGQLTATTCTVQGNNQANDFTVTLPTLSNTVLPGSGSVAGSTGFTINLTQCTPKSGNVHTFWEYGANTLGDGNLKNNGTAANVEVQLVDYNGSSPSAIDVSKADGAQDIAGATPTVSISSGAADLQYAAQYIAPTAAAGAGSVSTSVIYSIVYQ
jgi:major type 1 subunit fimbrin (pilin)